MLSYLTTTTTSSKVSASLNTIVVASLIVVLSFKGQAWGRQANTLHEKQRVCPFVFSPPPPEPGEFSSRLRSFSSNSHRRCHACPQPGLRMPSATFPQATENDVNPGGHIPRYSLRVLSRNAAFKPIMKSLLPRTRFTSWNALSGSSVSNTPSRSDRTATPIGTPSSRKNIASRGFEANVPPPFHPLGRTSV